MPATLFDTGNSRRIYGVDGLQIGIYAELLDDRFLDELDRRKLAAQLANDAEASLIHVAGLEWQVLGKGYAAREGFANYPYVLQNDHMSWMISRAGKDRDFEEIPYPNMVFTFRAVALWQLHWLRLWGTCLEIIDDINKGQWRSCVQRVDLCCDWIGGEFRPNDETHMVGRAHKVELIQFTAPSMHTEVPLTWHKDRGRFSGWTIGKGRLMCRIYNKVFEIQKSRKRWFWDVWGVPEEERRDTSVWRVEYQLRRDFLRQDRWNASAVPKVDTVEDLILHTATLWDYLSSRWLSFRSGGQQVQRRPLAPGWRLIHDEANDKWGDADSIPEKRNFVPDIDHLLNMMHGLLSSVGAVENVHDWEASIRKVQELLRDRPDAQEKYAESLKRKRVQWQLFTE